MFGVTITGCEDVVVFGGERETERVLVGSLPAFMEMLSNTLVHFNNIPALRHVPLLHNITLHNLQSLYHITPHTNYPSSGFGFGKKIALGCA
jgi:hypothetical protein